MVSPAKLLPRDLSSKRLQPFIHRIEAIEQAADILEAFQRAGRGIEEAADKAALFDRLLHGEKQGPFSLSVESWREVEVQLEEIELRISLEQQRICSDVLGVSVGGIVQTSHGQTKILVEHMSCYKKDSGAAFHLYGRKFRKDGLLGKRGESVYLEVGFDS